MTEGTIAALLSLLGVLGAAALAWLTAAQAANRKNIQRIEKQNNALWYYTRHLIDWGYKNGDEPPPDPPESIRHLYEFGETT